MSKKTKKPKATFVSFLLDETGSMQEIKDDTVGGFNAYVETLQKGDGDIVFSLVSFNSNMTERRYVAEPIAKVEPLTDDTYQPRAMTPLIDAAVKIIKATDEAVSKRKDKPNVVVVMQTDGQENVSVEYTNADLAALIKEKDQAGWQFVFLGAGLDAFAAAREAGIMIDAQQVVAYDKRKSKAVFG
ncbi:MAG: VWA domain-containing protein, partial [Proteobacteria bacterium]|nr:VWA domain-containing protein [Pseudomonadota bacterium]